MIRDEGVRVRWTILLRGEAFGPDMEIFVRDSAETLGLGGWVEAGPAGVRIEIEGAAHALYAFGARLQADAPQPIDEIDVVASETTGQVASTSDVFRGEVPLGSFEIRPSIRDEDEDHASPDLAVCPECRREVLDPADRRYRYPFASCALCGPRFSILTALPYVRSHTTMHQFTPCPECRRELEDPADRRHRAQTIACPRCGPELSLTVRSGKIIGRGDPALMRAAEALGAGSIVAVKGLGGFQLLVDAEDEPAVQRLRRVKGRTEKPLAVLYDRIDVVRREYRVGEIEERHLTSREAPIVLLAPGRMRIAPSVAPRVPEVGVRLPATPLEILLLRAVGRPLVVTSGNLPGEPVCLDEQEAWSLLGNVADLFLGHDQRVVRALEDSVVRIVGGRTLVLRRARGYVPRTVRWRETDDPGREARRSAESSPAARSILALGGSRAGAVVLATESGALAAAPSHTLRSHAARLDFEHGVADLESLHSFRPDVIVVDAEPRSSVVRFAHRHGEQTGAAVVDLSDPHSHALSCMLDNRVEAPVLAAVWDACGAGGDGTFWGGEFLRVDPSLRSSRVAHFAPFPLPGGELASAEPRRCALGLLWSIYGDQVFDPLWSRFPTLAAFDRAELPLLSGMLRRQIRCPWTTSVECAFQALASMIGLRQRTTYEGQSLWELEDLVGTPAEETHYPLRFRRPAGRLGGTEDPPAQAEGEGMERDRVGGGSAAAPWVLDWYAILEVLLSEWFRGVPRRAIAARFHRTLVEALALVVRASGETRVVLSGRCFQSRPLTEWSLERLAQLGVGAYFHRDVPPGDEGIAFGQAWYAARTQPAPRA